MDAVVALRRIVRSLRLADRQAELACGVSAAQLFVLETLGAAPHLSQAELAVRTLTDQSSVSTVVAKLVERGLVARTPSRTDRRRTELALTAAGRATLARAPGAPQAQVITAIRAMTARERAELVRALERLAAGMGADEVAPRMLFDTDDAGPPHDRRRQSRAKSRT